MDNETYHNYIKPLQEEAERDCEGWPDDEPNYGLCHRCDCATEDDCEHYDMPLAVIGGRKKKCKGYKPWDERAFLRREFYKW